MDYIKNIKRPYLEGQRGNLRNVYDQIKDYDNSIKRQTPEELDNTLSKNYLNEKMFVNNSRFIPKLPKTSNEIEMEQIFRNQPVNDHFHPDKGSKYNVEVDY